ncbi:MAG: sigma-54 dependent transcriptional regulator [Polyangiaceae bacterium]
MGLALVVDDDESVTELVCAWLGREGWSVDELGRADALFEALEVTIPDVVLLDLQLPDRDGMSVLAELRERFPEVAVVMLTANRDVDTVVAAMRLGAVDYVAKPFDPTRLSTAARNAAERARLGSRVRQLEQQLRTGAYRGIVGRSDAMQRLFRELDHVVASDVTVLIHGESGTGKELVARALHDGGRRSKGPFIAVNCAAIPENLVESELFGHERGAFTSATSQHRGCIERATGGTLFLDEIAELPLGMQAKLLRVLQERTFRRVGGTVDVHSDFRLVSATHRELRDAASAGRFREDLYYRVAVFEVELPPLRERAGDIPLLAHHMARQIVGKDAPGIADDTVAAMERYSWPGNVRELRNAIERALVVCGTGPIRPQDLPPALTDRERLARRESRPEIAPHSSNAMATDPSADSESVTSMENIEREALRQALARAGGNVSAAVRELGIGRTTIYRKMKKLGLT